MADRVSGIIPRIHRLVSDNNGENYWFNGCAAYAAEALGDAELDYWLFAALTGDLFVQFYSYGKADYDAVSGYRMAEDPKGYAEGIFRECGLRAAYVSGAEARGDPEAFRVRLMDLIDRGVPLIDYGDRRVGVFVGYEGGGETLLFLTHEETAPRPMPLSEATSGGGGRSGFVFVEGRAAERANYQRLYRMAIEAIPALMGVRTDSYVFGPGAFYAWADGIEGGRFDAMPDGEFDLWGHHTNYVCALATNGSCCHGFLERALAANPDMGYLREVGALYRRHAEMWGGDDHRNDPDSLEAIGGGFNATLETLRDPPSRARIAAKIRECGDVAERIKRLMMGNAPRA